MDINLRIPALDGLVGYVISGIVGPTLAPWKACRETKAKLIVARGEAEIQGIHAMEQAKTFSVISNAQKEAYQQSAKAGYTMQSDLTIAQAIELRVQFQEQKRQSNIGAVVQQAALELGDKDVTDHEPDHDWTARFFNEVQDISSEKMQFLWAKILAGEIERPSSTSIKTLNILRNLDQATAKLFAKYCSMCIALIVDEHEPVDIRVPSLGGNAATNALRQYGFSFDALNTLNEHGLIISDYNSWRDYQVAILTINMQIRLPFLFQGRYWGLFPKNADTIRKELKISGVALTQSGRQFSRIVELEAMDDFAQDLMKFFKKQDLEMKAVSWSP